jgi:hypothetical protein
MSAIMMMYTLGSQYVPALNDGEAILLEYGQRVNQEYGWSGYCMLYTLMYLEEQGLVFETRGEYTILTPADRGFLERLDPARHSAAELDAFLMEDLDDGDDGDDGDDDEERRGWAGQAGLDSLRLLHDQLEHMSDGEVLLVRIC